MANAVHAAAREEGSSARTEAILSFLAPSPRSAALLAEVALSVVAGVVRQKVHLFLPCEVDDSEDTPRCRELAGLRVSDTPILNWETWVGN